MKDIKKMKDIYILGIETSCDETSAAVIKNGTEVLSNVVNTQLETHKRFGGVVPEIASRMHVENIAFVVEKAIKEAKIRKEELSAVAVTKGPGLVGALLVGISFAKAFAYSLNIPIVPVNHLSGHISANYSVFKELKPPFLSLVISGGHTHLVDVKTYTDMKIIGKTRDDAVGEAFDKIARVLGLGYPGGPIIDKLAYEGKNVVPIPYPNVPELDFSFSGIKTSIINLHHKNPEIDPKDVATSFQKVVKEILYDKTLKALSKTGYKKIVLAGGVSANTHIREYFKQLEKNGIKVFFPPIDLCTDNAAMIAIQGYYNFEAGTIEKLNMNAVPNLKIGEI